MKTYKYRIYPTKKQTTLLLRTMEASRLVYNKLLELCKKKYQEDKKGYTKGELQSLVGEVRKELQLEDVAVLFLRFAKDRLEASYNHFFKKHNKFPRFKGKDQYYSVGLYGDQYSITEDGKIKLLKIGCVKINLHREFKGNLKQMAIKKTHTNKWFLTITTDFEDRRKYKKTKKKVGMDLGLKTFATFSDGNKIENPRFFKESERELAKVQRKLSKQKKGSQERRKAKFVVAKVHEKIVNKRTNFIHQESEALVRRYDFVAYEDLNIDKMNKNKRLAKSIQDVAWGGFCNLLPYKALRAGKEVVKNNPKNTSKMCNKCGNIKEDLKLKDRTYRCEKCGNVEDRDLNASKNILRLGLQSFGEKSIEAHML